MHIGAWDVYVLNQAERRLACLLLDLLLLIV